MITQTVGVVIGRFQTPYLHTGHRHLLDEVLSRHGKVCILVGTRQGQPTSRDPLDFQIRRMMLETEFPGAVVRPLADHPSNEEWSKQVDAIIEAEFPGVAAVLYCSRDGFRDAYSGKLNCELICEVSGYTATALRQAVLAVPKNSEDFRTGIIYGAMQRFPTSYQAVDVAILHTTEPKVLLAHKPQDADKWRFVGGFVDPKDGSLERAAKREALEEVKGVELDEFRYIGSSRIIDTRYRRQPDQVMTALVSCYYIFGRPEAADDIDAVSWQPLDNLLEVLIPTHQCLGEMLLKHLSTKNNERKEEEYVNA